MVWSIGFVSPLLHLSLETQYTNTFLTSDCLLKIYTSHRSLINVSVVFDHSIKVYILDPIDIHCMDKYSWNHNFHFGPIRWCPGEKFLILHPKEFITYSLLVTIACDGWSKRIQRHHHTHFLLSRHWWTSFSFHPPPEALFLCLGLPLLA